MEQYNRHCDRFPNGWGACDQISFPLSGILLIWIQSGQSLVRRRQLHMCTLTFFIGNYKKMVYKCLIYVVLCTPSSNVRHPLLEHMHTDPNLLPHLFLFCLMTVVSQPPPSHHASPVFITWQAQGDKAGCLCRCRVCRQLTHLHKFHQDNELMLLF